MCPPRPAQSDAGMPSAEPGHDAGCERVLDELIAWLGRAQDLSASADGGVARDYSLVSGWATSYPETTGYIIPTLLDYAQLTGQAGPRERARGMVDWLVRIQLPCGGFQGGKIDSVPVVPVTFNTGQILMGLAAAEVALGGYLEPMKRAADWLVATQDADGCWRKHPTPFAAPGEKAYETHVSSGLFEAARVEPGRGYGEAGLANVRWALRHQMPNGWFAKCCLDLPDWPLTHTIGYVLRGVLDAYRHSGEPEFLDAARLTSDALLGCIAADGRLAGRLHQDWSAAVDWVCLTGSAQIAHCMLSMFQYTGDERYRVAGRQLNHFVRRTVRCDGPAATRGAVKGSFPIDGAYGRYAYLNWAAKFLADSLMLEMALRSREDERRIPVTRGERGSGRAHIVAGTNEAETALVDMFRLAEEEPHETASRFVDPACAPARDSRRAGFLRRRRRQSRRQGFFRNIGTLGLLIAAL